MGLDAYFESNGWKVVDVQHIPKREAQLFPIDDLALSTMAKTHLNRIVPDGIYRHQKEGIDSYEQGENICLTTGTASGKSLIFYVSAMNELLRDSSAKILAIYPMKALGKEQEERWNLYFRKAGLNFNVGRIDGQVAVGDRLRILKNSSVLIATPDVIHAWMMSNLSNKGVLKFLSKLKVIIVDEVHNYTGVFGSNSAYLFRRLRHVLSLSGANPRFIAASATISKPVEHLQKLFGINFKIINELADTSPRHPLEIQLIEPPIAKDLLSVLSELMDHIAKETQHRFITFVDSRKQAEYIASIVARSKPEEEDESINFDHLQSLSILPYRAGYEERDRSAIQRRLSGGDLRGVVSTSALELGIDIPHLTLAILFGVPRSSTSLFQRIGRIGRNAPGNILIVNTGDIYNEGVFRSPKDLLKMPPTEGALYLENSRIQYIHTLCLARLGGEHSQVFAALNSGAETDFKSSIEWPDGFLERCRSERIGVIPPEFQSIKAEAGDDPNHAYPLRDVDVQFQVEFKSGPAMQSLGSLSHGQMMREAYPGAVYYYTTIPYRVHSIKMHKRLVEVRRERRYTTKPQMLPTLVFPNISADTCFNYRRYGDLLVSECAMQIRETIVGYKERRGPNEITVGYPLDPSTGLFFNFPRFTRNYFTTGVVISHPILNSPGVKPDMIAQLMFEAFLSLIPLERRDVQYANDKHRSSSAFIQEGDKFICLYDQTYGSLRLSGKILEDDLLRKTAKNAVEFARYNHSPGLTTETIGAINEIFNSLEQPMSLVNISSDEIPLSVTDHVKIILPGSSGLNINKDNEEFFIERVYYHPTIGGLAYRGKYFSQMGVGGKKFVVDRDSKGKILDIQPIVTVTSIPISSLVPIPGESKMGIYDINSGEILPSETDEPVVQ